MSGCPHSDDLRRKASRCFFLGWGYKKTAKHLDLSPYTVRDWFRTWRIREDVDPGYLPEAVYEHPVGLRSQVREARRGGMTLTELEALFCVPRRTIRFWCYGIPNPNEQTSSKFQRK